MPTQFFCIALLLLTAPVAFGQGRSTGTSLPTYQQIKPTGQEIYDYVPPRGTIHQSIQRTFGLFDYPNGTVMYIVNGKIVSKVSEVRTRIASPGVTVDSLSIGPPDASGKRLIRIRMLPIRQ